MAHGIADDIVSTTYISVTCPVLVAPAMNVRMWEHVTVRQNLDTLRAELLQRHGHETTRHGEWIVIDGAGRGARRALPRGAV